MPARSATPCSRPPRWRPAALAAAAEPTGAADRAAVEAAAAALGRLERRAARHAPARRSGCSAAPRRMLGRFDAALARPRARRRHRGATGRESVQLLVRSSRCAPLRRARPRCRMRWPQPRRALEPRAAGGQPAAAAVGAGALARRPARRRRRHRRAAPGRGRRGERRPHADFHARGPARLVPRDGARPPPATPARAVPRCGTRSAPGLARVLPGRRPAAAADLVEAQLAAGDLAAAAAALAPAGGAAAGPRRRGRRRSPARAAAVLLREASADEAAPTPRAAAREAATAPRSPQPAPGSPRAARSRRPGSARRPWRRCGRRDRAGRRSAPSAGAPRPRGSCAASAIASVRAREGRRTAPPADVPRARDRRARRRRAHQPRGRRAARRSAPGRSRRTCATSTGSSASARASSWRARRLSLDPPIIVDDSAPWAESGSIGRASHVVTHLVRGRSALANGHGVEAPRESGGSGLRVPDR